MSSASVPSARPRWSTTAKSRFVSYVFHNLPSSHRLHHSAGASGGGVPALACHARRLPGHHALDAQVAGLWCCFVLLLEECGRKESGAFFLLPARRTSNARNGNMPRPAGRRTGAGSRSRPSPGAQPAALLHPTPPPPPTGQQPARVRRHMGAACACRRGARPQDCTRGWIPLPWPGRWMCLCVLQ